MEDNKVIDEIVRKWSATVLRRVITALAWGGKRASGKLIENVNLELKRDLNTISVSLTGPEYFINVVNGRRPGAKPPPVGPIREWCRIKGIPEAAAFPIARNIGRFGIKPFKNPLNIVQKNVGLLNERLAKDYGQAMSVEVVEMLKNIKRK